MEHIVIIAQRYLKQVELVGGLIAEAREISGIRPLGELLESISCLGLKEIQERYESELSATEMRRSKNQGERLN